MVSKVSQSDWGGGLWRSGNKDRVPDNASNELQEMFLSEDGLPFERGGATRKSNAAVGSSGLMWVWDGWLAGGQRTVFGSGTGLARGLSADDATPFALSSTLAQPIRPVVVAGTLVFPGSNTDPAVLEYYGGSQKTTGYIVGTVTVTQDSTTVTGAGTSWLANVDAGMVFHLNSEPNTPLVVARVVSDTSLELVTPWPLATAAGATYFLSAAWSASLGYRFSTVTSSVANRFVAATYDDRTVLRFSAPERPTSFAADDFHHLPGKIVGLAPLRDVLMVFTSAGVYAVSGMAYNLASVTGDPQQRIELANADLVAWGHEGIAPWSGALVVPARDGIWLIDSVSSPQKISLPIDDLYLSYVNAGYKPGVAEVFNGHYFLPILNGSNVWQDTLVCRLTQTRSGPPFAWSRLRGADAQVAAYAERSGTPLLLAASLLSSSRVLDCTSYFAPAAAVKADSDSSTRQAVWESREFALSDMPTTVRRVRVWYELTDAAADAPVIGISYAKDSDTSYTEVDNSLGGVQGRGGPSGVASDGTLYHWVPVNKRAHGMRFRVRTFGNNAGFKIRQVELVTEAVQNQ